MGSVIEYYDFLVFGLAAALVFPEVFFPNLGSAAGTVASFATFGVAFVARPLGSLVFGHFGDRLGRKRTLVITLVLMGAATVVVGVMPSADRIGIAAPILVVVMRILQGFAAGGEYAGAALLATEYAPPGQRGFWGMAANFGGGVALALGYLTFLITSLTMSSDQFISYGWRIPFILSLLLVMVGLYVRLRIDETPIFRHERDTAAKATRIPLVEAARSQPREIALASGMAIVVPTMVYLGASYLTNYGTHVLGLSFDRVLLYGLIGGVAVTSSIAAAALLSDRLGRRLVMIIGCALSLAWTVVLFPLLDSGGEAVYGVAVFVTLLIAGIPSGPIGSYLSELFLTRYRYTAAGFSYNVAQIVGGAIPPVIGAAITSTFNAFTFGLLLAFLSLISLVCTLGLKETRGTAMDRP